MELRVLRYFLTIAREESISKAAESLFLTQPTLSRQIQMLENELGTVLFIRGKRKITLTEDGELLKRRAEELLELEDKIEKEFTDKSQELSGVIYIGAAEAKGFAIISQAMKSFKVKYPNVTFDIFSGIADNVLDKIDKGLLDIGMVLEPGDISKYNVLNLNIEERCGVIMNSSSSLVEKPYVTMEDLKDRPIIGNKRVEVQSFYRKAYGSSYDSLNFIATFNLINNAVEMVKEGFGYAFAIKGSVANHSKEDVVFRPLEPKLSQRTYVVYKKYQTNSKLVMAFIEEISQYITTSE